MSEFPFLGEMSLKGRCLVYCECLQTARACLNVEGLSVEFRLADSSVSVRVSLGETVWRPEL